MISDTELQELRAETQRLPAGAGVRARSIAWVKPPDHLAHLVPRVRREHGAKLGELHRMVDERLAGQPIGEERGAFYAASELALIERVWRAELPAGDRSSLRVCWEHLLSA